jgi:hypothetical protein
MFSSESGVSHAEMRYRPYGFPMRMLVPLVVSALALAPLAGCAAPLAMAAPLGMDAARVGANAYTRGELRVARFATLEETWQATHLALERLQLTVHTERIGERRWYIMAKDENHGPEMRISLDRRSPVMTRISIRVGIFGDPAVSNQIVRQIDLYLAEVRQQPPFLTDS